MLLNARDCRTFQSWWLEMFRTDTALYSVMKNSTYVFKREALLQYYKDLIKATVIQRSMAKRVDKDLRKDERLYEGLGVGARGPSLGPT